MGASSHAQLDRGDRSAQGPVPAGRLSTGRGWARRPGLLQFPCRPLEGDLVQQPLGAPQQGDPAAHRCGGYLPQAARRAPPGWGRPSRAARRMGRRPSIHDTRFGHLQQSSNGSRTRGSSGLDYITRMTYSYTTLRDVTPAGEGLGDALHQPGHQGSVWGSMTTMASGSLPSAFSRILCVTRWCMRVDLPMRVRAT